MCNSPKNKVIDKSIFLDHINKVTYEKGTIDKDVEERIKIKVENRFSDNNYNEKA